MSEHDISFDAMGSHVRLLIGEPGPEMVPAAEAAEQARRFIHGFDATLSRFKPGSELCALNQDERERVPASALLREAVQAGLERGASAATASSTRPWCGRSRSAGYVASRAGMQRRAAERGAGRGAPAPPAQPNPAQAWRRFEVDEEAGEIVRPPGLALRHRRHRQGPRRRPARRRACAATRASSSTAAATSGSAAPTPWSTRMRSSSSTR